MTKFDYEKAILDQYVFNKLLLEQEGICIDDLTEEQLHHYLKEFSIHLADEVFEFLRHLNWKMHKTNRTPIDREKVLEEIVDIFKFAFNMLLFLKVPETDFQKMWSYKTKKVWQRWINECKKKNELESVLHADGEHGEVEVNVQPPSSGSSTDKG